MASSALTEVLRETLALFEGPGEPRTTTEVANSLDLGRRSTYERLERLVDHGRLKTKKVGGNGRVWWRPPANTDATPDWSAAAESLIDDVLDSAEVGIFVLNADLEVAWINDATERYFGLDRERVLGRDKRRLIEEEIASVVDEEETFTETVLATYDDNTYAEQFECRVTPDDTEAHWLEHRSKPIEAGAYAGGRVELYYDVTDRKHSEQIRQEERQEFESLITAVEEYAIFGMDTDGRVRTWNAGAEQIKGYAADEIVGEHVSTFYTDADRDAGVPRENLAAAAEEGSVEDEGWRVRADGSRFWANVTITAIRDDDGALQGYAKVTHDMTEHHKNERQLENRYRTLVEHFPNGAVALVDEDLCYQTVGGDPLDAVDATAEEIEGRPVREIVPPELADKLVSSYEAAFEGESTTFEAESNGRVYQFQIVPVQTGDGNVSTAMGMSQDITEHVETQRKLAESEQRYRTLVEHFPNGSVGLFDRELTYSVVGGDLIDDLGFSPDEIVGTTISRRFPDEVVDRIDSNFRTVFDGESNTFEIDLGDRDLLAQTVPVRNAEDEVDAGMLVVRDITERRERERALEESERRYRTLVENFPNGAVILFDEDLQYLIAGGEAFEGLDVTPKDLEGETIPERLPAELVDTFEPRFRAVFEGQASEFEFEFNDQIRQFRAVPVRDESGSVSAGLVISQDVTEHRKHERELERQREQLAALNSLNDTVREITEAVIDQSTREEIETIVCERLAESNSYEFAWMAEVDPQTMALDPHVEAGVSGYLEEASISTDPDEPSGQGPAGRAIRTREVQTTQNAMTDPDFEPWREHAKTYGYRSSAGIPIIHDGTLYGLLGVYADRPKAFEGQERDVIGQLGEIVGHAIAAIERKQALMSDELVELEFQIRDVFTALDLPVETDGTITLDHTVPVGDGEFLVYGTATPDAIDTITRITENVPHWKECIIRSEGDPTGFELRMTDPPVLSVVASLGGYVEQAVIEDGDYQMTIHLAPSVDVRRVTDAVEAAYPDAEMLRRRQISRDHDDSKRFQRHLVEDLTDRQQTALETAYHAGFFEWPRDTSGEEVAESIGVAPPTFHQHLRKAERKVFDTIYSSPMQSVE